VNSPRVARKASRLAAQAVAAARPRRPAPRPANEVTSHLAAFDMTAIVGANLRRVRRERGLSLAGLSDACGVSRAMLSQVELGKSTPTINLLWRIASALAVPFSTLLSDDAPKSATVLRAASAKVLMSSDGAFASRELSPADGARPVEFYELHLAPRSAEHCAAHPVGTKANLVIASGSLSILVSGERYDLEARDAIFFSADCPHELRNESDEEARVYLVIVHDNRAAVADRYRGHHRRPR